MEKPDRVFYDDAGKLYKAKSPKSPSHAEVNFPTPDMLRVLTDESITREVMTGKILEVVAPEERTAGTISFADVH